MSLPDRMLTALSSLRITAMAVVVGTLAAGCTVQPLYSSGGAENAGAISVAPDMREKLASVSVDQVGDIYALEVRNSLIFLLGGGKGEPANPTYKLALGLSKQVIDSISVDVGDSVDKAGRPSAGTVQITANYILSDADGRVVATGKRTVSAGFDRPRQEFASLRAERNATKRAAQSLAEQVYLSLAQNLSKR